jgi:acetyl esterase/lipase
MPLWCSSIMIGRRKPNTQYPTAVEQAYAATRYVADHGRELDLDPMRLVVLGDSVGGNMGEFKRSSL